MLNFKNIYMWLTLFISILTSFIFSYRFFSTEYLLFYDFYYYFSLDIVMFFSGITMSVGIFLYFLCHIKGKVSQKGKNIILIGLILEIIFNLLCIFRYIHYLDIQLISAICISLLKIYGYIGIFIYLYYLQKLSFNNRNRIIKSSLLILIADVLYLYLVLDFFMYDIIYNALFVKPILILSIVPYFYSLCKEQYNNEQNNIENNTIYDKNIIYELRGARGKSIKVYNDKVVIAVNVGIGSFFMRTFTNGEKTIYYKDVIGVQLKKCGKILIGYLQLETASVSKNNGISNFFSENSFVYDTTSISNEKMEEVANYVKKQVEVFKNIGIEQVNSFSNADEIKKYKELLDMRAITEEEFECKKQELLK